MQRLSVPIWLPENAPPPRNRAALRGSFSPPVVLPHALACGLVLLLVMAFLGVLPACAELSCARGLLFLGALDALLHGFRRLSAASVASGSPALGVGGRGQCGQYQEEGEGFKTHGAKMRFVGRATRCNSVLRPQPNGGHRKNCEVFWLQATRCHRCTLSRQSTEACQMFLRTTEVD